MTISISRLYNLLSGKVGQETAEKLTSYIEEKIKEEVHHKTSNLATKEELAKEIAGVRTEIASTKAELVRWMFIFWTAQVAATFGFILLFLKK